jgi:hypothetical protein
MAENSLSRLVPVDKMEIAKAEALVKLGYPAVEPLLPQIVGWMQDLNWPVAQVFQPFLASIGLPLAPHVRSVLATEDDIWKYWVLLGVVRNSPELTNALLSDLVRLAHRPTAGEEAEGVSQVAQEILRSFQA